MDTITTAELEQEPIGIIISNGSREEAAPRFWAYEWWPGPDEVPEVTRNSGSTRAA